MNEDNDLYFDMEDDADTDMDRGPVEGCACCTGGILYLAGFAAAVIFGIKTLFGV